MGGLNFLATTVHTIIYIFYKFSPWKTIVIDKLAYIVDFL